MKRSNQRWYDNEIENLIAGFAKEKSSPLPLSTISLDPKAETYREPVGFCGQQTL